MLLKTLVTTKLRFRRFRGLLAPLIGKLVDFHLRALRVLRGYLIPPKTAERQRLLSASRGTEYFPYQSSHTVAHQTR